MSAEEQACGAYSGLLVALPVTVQNMVIEHLHIAGLRLRDGASMPARIAGGADAHKLPHSVRRDADMGAVVWRQDCG